MSNSQSFLKTLKQIGYPEAEMLYEPDLDSMFVENYLAPFLRVFCSLNENNVLTTEEIQEYSALSVTELAELEAMDKSLIFKTNTDEENKKKRANFLQEQLTQIEQHNKTLKKNMELFKQHNTNLVQEKEASLTLLSNAKKKFQLFQMEILPEAENEYISSLQSILLQIEELESLISLSDTNECKIPASEFFRQIIADYLSSEEKILLSVTTFLDTNFQLKGDDDPFLSFISTEILENKEMLKESGFLQKSMKEQMFNKIMSEKEVKKIESAIKNSETVLTSPELNCHVSQLRSKLQDATELNERLKNKEEDLNKFLSDTISNNVDAHFSQIVLSLNQKTDSHLQCAIKEILLPMNILILQRGRLEMLLASLQVHERDGPKALKQLIDSVSNQVQQEQSTSQASNVQIEKELKVAVPEQKGLNPETSIFVSLYKILALPNDLKNNDISHVTLEDVLERAKIFFEIEENRSKRDEEYLKTIETMEEHVAAAEALLDCSGKTVSNWRELDQTLNKDLNSLSIKLTAVETNVTEITDEFDKKKKHLKAKANLELARKLYVYALRNKGLLKKCIDKIKEAAKKSAF